MAQRYFELIDEMSSPDRWLLGDPVDEQGNEVRTRQFMSGEPSRFDGRLRVPIYHPGTSLDFSRADTSGIPVVSQKVADVLLTLAPGDIQLIPVEMDSRPEPYFLVNVSRLVKCIDDEACEEVLYWKPEDGRPDKVGQYRDVYGMRIDPSKVGDVKVFRPWGYKGSLIVSEDIKEALERTGVTGTEFREVTGPRRARDEHPQSTSHGDWLRQVDAARESAWRALGTLEEEAIVPIVPSGPAWPGQRQAWRVIHRTGKRLLLVTDGLSDPFLEQAVPSVGFGLELAIETDEPVKDVQGSWLLQVLQRVANELAEHERVREAALKGQMTMEVSGKGVPKPLVTRDGRVGVLLGVESNTLPQHITTPAGDVRLVTVKTLLPTELAYRVQHGKQGREELARRFAENGEEHLSRARRRAVV
ncbi:suppressor of fused domain protein [Archangium violaceum]|uniref:imm11 family protein n=1 Tax=Archangium violaceum TaxID=83451 RepID=UPI002B2D56F6|nr:suppressor of fused domain protein [Archangium gephyra]